MSFRGLLIAGAAAFALMLPGAAEAQTSGAVTTDLNLRAGPGTGHGVIATMPAGSSVSVHQCSGGWCQISYAGRTGWASQRYIDTRVAAAGPAYGGPAYGAPVYGGPVYSPRPRVGFEFHVGPTPRYHWRDWRRPAHYGGWHRSPWWHGRPAGWYGPVYWDRSRWWYGDRWYHSPGFAVEIGLN